MKHVLSIFLLLLISIPILAEEYKNKVALVIGNQNYEPTLSGFEALETPKIDAIDMATILDSIGFKITNKGAVLDANRDKMHDVIKKFAQECKEADLALFYYSGHGVCYEREYLLIPVDEDFKKNDNVREFSIELSYLADELKFLECKKIVILDACRNAPDFIPNNRVVQAPKDYDGVDVIYYATQQNKPAYQRVNGSSHSIYTDVWLKYLQKNPEEDLSNMFMMIRQDVADATEKENKGKQVPFQNGTISGTLFNFPNSIDSSSLSHVITSKKKITIKRHNLGFTSIGYHYPSSFDIRIGMNFSNWFADLGVGTPFKQTNKYEIMNSSGNLVTTQSYKMYDVKTRCGYMWNQNKWHYGVYAGYSWGVIKGNNPKLSAGGINIHSFVPGVQLEYTLAKRIALFANIEGKLAFSKGPSANYNEIKACCPEVNDWAKPFGIGIGLKFNFTKK